MSRGFLLRADQIAVIRSELARKTPRAEIAELVGVHRTTVDKVANGELKYRRVCDCGSCGKCRNRLYSAEYRERKKRDARERNRRIAA